MKLVAPLALLLIALSGCGEEKIVVRDNPDDSDSLAVAAPSDDAKVDVGDVEATVEVELTLETEGLPGVTVEELRNAKKKLSNLTATVSPPKPAELWFKILLKSTETFGARPTALRGKIFREVSPGNPEVIFTFHTVLDAFARKHSRVADGTYFPLEFRTDAIKGLTDLPPTMLVYAVVEAYMSPTGTDPASIDAATYTAGPEDTGNLMSNPVRINYVPAPVSLENPLGLSPAPDAATTAPAATPPAETPGVPNPFGVVPAAEAPAEAAPVAETPTAPETPVDSADSTTTPGAAQ